MTRIMIRRDLLAVVGGFALALGSFATPARSSAQAAGRVSAEVFVILAKTEPGTIAPELADMPALRRPPFSNFRSMTLLSRDRLELAATAPREIPLPNGRRLRVVLEERTPDGRHRMRVSINRPSQSDYLPLLQVVASFGDPFFVAGQNYQGGTLIIGIRLIPAG